MEQDHLRGPILNMHPDGETAWVIQNKSQLAIALAIVQLFCGFVTGLSAYLSCVGTGILQILTAVLVVAVEGPSFIEPLQFMQPVADFFDRKPLWIKAITYAVAVVIPCFPGCIEFFSLLGFLCGLGVAGLFGMLALSTNDNYENTIFQRSPIPPPYQGVFTPPANIV